MDPGPLLENTLIIIHKILILCNKFCNLREIKTKKRRKEEISDKTNHVM